MKKLLSVLLIITLIITGGVLAHTVKVTVNGMPFQLNIDNEKEMEVQSKEPDMEDWTSTGITLTAEEKSNPVVDLIMPDNSIELETGVKKSIITYDGNGGTGVPLAQIKAIGVDITLSTLKPTRSQYLFVEWNTAQNGSGTRYMPGDIYSIDQDVTLYAQWTKGIIFTWDTTGQLTKSIQLKTNAATTINWGDGTSENVAASPSSELTLSHTYASAGEYTVRLRDNVVTVFLCANKKVSYMDVSNATVLKYFSCASNNLNNLDVSNNVALETLICLGNNLTSLDISNNTALEYLLARNNKLTSLNVSNNTALTYLNCRDNNISSLDVSNNTELIELHCFGNKISSLDVSNNLLLNGLTCSQPTLNILVMDSRQSVTPSRHTNTKIVTLTQTPNGKIKYSRDYKFNMIPNEGYHVISITAGGISQIPAIVYDFEVLPNDTTLTATFGNTYNVVFDGNGGVGSPDIQSKTYGVDLVLSTTIPTRVGNQFVCWNTKPDGSGTNYTSGGIYKMNENVVLYAQWAQLYTVTIFPITDGPGGPAGGTWSGDGSYTIGTKVKIKATPRLGYAFAGWTVDSGNVTLANTTTPITTFTLNGDATILAHFKKVYIITYDVNEGYGDYDRQIKLHGENITLSNVEPTRNGYEFIGWNTKVNGTGTAYAKGATYTANANAKLYAQWQMLKYTITLDNQGATTSGSSAIYEKYLDGIYKELACTNKMTTSTNPITVPTKDNYVFGGYYTLANGEGTRLINASGYITDNFTSTIFNRDITIYAKWTPVVYTINLNSGW